MLRRLPAQDAIVLFVDFEVLRRGGILKLLSQSKATEEADYQAFVRATGNIPENINFAIKTGAIRDFLDNSVVPYETAEPKGELKTAEIAAR